MVMRTQTLARSGRRQLGWLWATVLPLILQAQLAVGQNQPAYRVARETAEDRQATAASGSPFDFTQQPGEHPLGPVVRVMEGVLANIESNVSDYSCTLTKQERIDGELGDPQHIVMKVRNQPFSVYMKFLQPHKNREVIYVDGQNDGNLLALDGGWKRGFGIMNLDPEGSMAMRGQKYPITRVGIRNLVAEYIRLAKADMKFGECQVTTDPNQKIDGRPVTMIQAVHPVPRQEFQGYMARVFLDNELRVPIHYDAYMWPDKKGGRPPLVESYTYRNLRINNGFTARDFDTDNPNIFQ